MKANISRLGAMAGCFMCFSAAALDAPTQTAEQPTIELLRTVKVQGEYVSLQGASLFVTNSVRTKLPGYWLDLGKDRTAPSLINANLPGAWDVAVVGRHAFVCDYTEFLPVFELEGQKWQLASRMPMPSMTENIIIRGRMAYIANHTAGLTVVDITDPKKPILVSNLNPKIDCDAIGFQSDCAILYGHHESRLVCVDVSDPAKPRQVGVYQHDDKTFTQGEIQVVDGLAYCTAKTGLVIVDVSAPAKPKLVTTFEMKTVLDVKVHHPYAFVSSRDGVMVLDVRSPANPVELASLKCSVREIAVEKSGDAYNIYAGGKEGLSILRFRPSSRRE